MDYMRPVKGKEITCTARVAKTGRTLTWVEGIITDDNGIEVARTKFIWQTRINCGDAWKNIKERALYGIW